jgi:cardiolipin synthase
VLEIPAHIEAVGLSAAHILTASAVTLHVLLRRREVGSSVGWIGLAWLSPFFGSALYLMFGINRVRRRAHRMRTPRAPHRDAAPAVSPRRRDDHLAPLQRAIDRIARRPLEHGNAMHLLQNGDEAYPVMIAAIDGARVSVALASYIFRADATGRAFTDALARAMKRGVAVRVLIDGYGSGYLLSLSYWRLRWRGIKAVRFMHSLLPWRMPMLNLRNHKKVLVIDGRIAFTGGLNVGSENVLSENPSHPVRDTHFRVEGPVVRQLMDVFAADWQFAAGEPLENEEWFPTLTEAGNVATRVIVSGPDQDLEKIEFVILEAIACARASIKIMTPYFLPDERLITALALAAMRGVDVDVIVPTLGNHPLVDWAMRAQVGPLLAAGCRIWRSPPPFDHTKLMTVDGLWGLVGSSNWDARSFRLNFELDMELYHTDLVHRIEALMEAMRSSPITLTELNSRSLPVRLLHSAARLMFPYL